MTSVNMSCLKTFSDNVLVSFLLHTYLCPSLRQEGILHMFTSATSLLALLLVLRIWDTRQPFQMKKLWLQECEKAIGLSSPALTASRREEVKHSLRVIPGSCVSKQAGLVVLLSTTITDAVLRVGTESSTSTFSHVHIQGAQLSLNKTLTSCYPPGSGTTGWHCQTCTILTC